MSRRGRHKQQRPPPRVAVFPLYYAAVYNACRHLHRMMLCLSDCRPSNDLASIVGGALERIFQLLRDHIDHHIPSCTAVVWAEEHTPNHKAAKALIHRYQALRLVLMPGRMIAPSRLLTHLRKGAYKRKFAEPSDDLHHLACLSSARACYGLRLQPAPAGAHPYRADKATSACLVRALFYKRTQRRKGCQAIKRSPKYGYARCCRRRFFILQHASRGSGQGAW
jgi:hypothetical protein